MPVIFYSNIVHILMLMRPYRALEVINHLNLIFNKAILLTSVKQNNFLETEMKGMPFIVKVNV